MNRDFCDLLRALSDAEARFLVVGAYAVSYHAEPRSTGDLDIWVEPTGENARRVHAALAAFGAPLAQLSVEDLTRPDVVFQMGVPPRRIDILTTVSGVGFQEAWAGRVEVAVEGLTFTVMGRDALIKNKRAAGRPKDLLDLETLERHPPTPPRPLTNR